MWECPGKLFPGSFGILLTYFDALLMEIEKKMQNMIPNQVVSEYD